MNIPKEVGQVIQNMYDELVTADKEFKQCQSTAFKSFAHSMLTAANTRKAMERFREELQKDTAKESK